MVGTNPKTKIQFLLPVLATVLCWMLAVPASAQTNGSAQADLAVMLLRFDPQNQGLAFTYTDQGGPLPTQTTAKLFWASATNTIDIITNVAPILTTNIPAGFAGQATNYVPESLLRFPPTNANYLLLVLDADNLLIESTKTNNTAVLRNTFRHVVLVMMENRSFDHLLGWLPNSDGKQAGLTYTNAAGQVFPTWNLAPYFQGCGCADPDHSFSGGRVEYADGACDGWLRANPNDNFSVGFYLQNDLSLFGQTAPQWTVCDRYFAAIMAETQPNRMYQHAAQTDSLTNREGLALLDFVTLPTIWDTLSQSNVSGLYYHAGAPIIGSVLSLWGFTKYSSISAGIDQFYQDCANGTLPAVSFVDPVLTSPFVGDTGGNDDHPYSDVRNGEAFLASVYNAIVSSPNWASTVLIINFDEWGGFFDHVPPPQLPISQIPPYEAKLGNDGRLGFRVPCLVISPWSRNALSQTGSVSHELFDHTSVLKMIENRWGLPALTVRDANANDLADVLDFDHPNFVPPPVLANVPPGPFGGPCETLQDARQANGDLVVSWDATCRKVTVQTAPTATGPWSNLTNVSVSPYVLTEAEQLKSAQGYFRFVLK
jgi:phospholipase C